MTMSCLKGSHARPVALTTLLALGLVLTGCNSNRPDPRAFGAPPNDAYALSGGKITRFVRAVDTNPNSITDRVMLKACRQLSLTSRTAHGTHYVVSCRVGTVSFPAIVVGKQALVVPNQLLRQMILPDAGVKKGYSYQLKGHTVTMARDGAILLYTGGPQFPQQYIVLTPGSKFADVGGTRVLLRQSLVWVEPEKMQVMLLSDWLKVFRINDAQIGGQSIRSIGYSATDVTVRN